MPTNIHLITFATKNWPKAIARMNTDLDDIASRFDFFKSNAVLNQDDLEHDFYDFLGYFTEDHAFAYWSWKPYVIMKKLDEVPDGDFVLYMDAGCVIPSGDKREPFLQEVLKKSKTMAESDEFLGISIGGPPHVRRVVRTEMQDFFGLRENSEFREDFPHYRATVLLIKNTKESRQFVRTWYYTMRDNYAAIVHSDFADTTGQCEDFIHNVGDQAVLHCLMYVHKIKPCICDDIFHDKFNLITRRRG